MPLLLVGQINWLPLPQPRAGLARTGLPILDELESAFRSNNGTRGGEPGDLVGWVHEGGHELNSMLRNATREHDNCFWVGEKRYVRLIEPKTRLSRVASRVPARSRGRVFQTYFGNRGWEEEPLYILDEWSCYVNGAQAELMLRAAGRRGRSDISTFENAVEFIAYGDALIRSVRADDPNYRQRAELEAFVAWLGNRSRAATAALRVVGGGR